VRITQTKQFKKDLIKQIKRGKRPEKLFEFLDMLIAGQELADRYRDHPLRGNWVGRRDCHLEPDWVLIYQKMENEIVLERTGSHSDLF
jgi:mRNA interferase YafQ